MKSHNAIARVVVLTCLLALAFSSMAFAAARTLENAKIKAEFDDHGLVSIADLANNHTVKLVSDGSAIKVDGETLDTSSMTPVDVKESDSSVTYSFIGDGWSLKVVYELQPAWGFVSKQLVVSRSGDAAYRVNSVEMLRTELDNWIGGEHKISGGSRGACLRFGEGAPGVGNSGAKPNWGMLFVVQNPFNVWQHEERKLSVSYNPELDWKPEYGTFASDRLLLAPYVLTGNEYLSKLIPEWKYVADPEAAVANAEDKIDEGEIAAYQGCVAAFTMFDIKKSVRIDVGWCENDYQIDCGTPEGMAEYKRIIDRTADLGGHYILYAPANSQVSSERESRDAWGWENVLWFGMGQKLRKGEWDPGKDPVPACVQEMIDYAKSKDIKLVAYAYPTLGYMQDPAWTAWCNNKPGGYSGVDTGVRSFQDWFVKKLVDFQKLTGAGGYSFDHWWIAYDSNKDAANPVTSRYAQWYGARRIIQELRKAVPDVVVDGRQQYHGFGAWTWVGGSYPHPFGSDEQPGSFRARSDLHTDRLSANHVRWINFKYRMLDFCPPQMVPGYMTHQTQRSDAKGTMHRDPWRRADWDYLGWRYSVLSSIATAPLNHVLNFIPARDTAEFNAFSKEDQAWWKKWMDWADQNQDILRNYKFIAPPMIGRTDGTAAFKDDKGFVFLFNANYRKLDAEFKLDDSIGLKQGKLFKITQLYPQEGLVVGKPGAGSWRLGDKVKLPMDGTSAIVLQVEPAATVTEPVLYNVKGTAALKDTTLNLTGVTGEMGTKASLLVALPEGKTIKAATVNGTKAKFVQMGSKVTIDVTFDGARFSQAQQIGVYDPKFDRAKFKGEFVIPSRIFDQLKARKKAWPVEYTDDDKIAPWVGPDRLLLFVNIADANAKSEVTMTIDGQPAEVKKAFNGIYPNSGNQTFIGWYVDVADLKPNVKHKVEVTLPDGLEPGQFQGLYFDNVEPEFTQAVKSN